MVNKYDYEDIQNLKMKIGKYEVDLFNLDNVLHLIESKKVDHLEVIDAYNQLKVTLCETNDKDGEAKLNKVYSQYIDYAKNISDNG